MGNHDPTHKDYQWDLIIVWISVFQIGDRRNVRRRFDRRSFTLFKERRHQRYERS